MSQLNDKANDILQQLDIYAEYKSWGVEITNIHVGPQGWLGCHAYGRQDKNPSAGINVAGGPKNLGRYKEFNGDCRNLSFWDAAALFGPYSTWQEARQHYADQVGIELEAKPKKAKPFLKEIAWVYPAAKRFCMGLEGVDPRILRFTGAVMAKRGSLRVIAWPVFGPGLEPVGHFYKNVLPGKSIQNANSSHKQLLTPGCSPCGWINARGLESIDKGVQCILWVEGVPDMLAAESARIREGKKGQEDLAIITSSHGAMTIPPNDVLARIQDIPTFVIGDADKDGQAGVVKKLYHLKHFCPAERWDLPYEVVEKHGKDLRDWLNEGHTLEELLASLPEPMGRDTSPPPASAAQPAKEQAKSEDGEDDDRAAEVLAKLDLHIAGRTPGGGVEIWNGQRERWEEACDVDKWRIDKFLQMTGPPGGELICDRKSDDDDRLPWATLRRHIAMQSGLAEILDQNRFGPGVWVARDEYGNAIPGELVIVDRDWAGVWNGESLNKLKTPFHRGMILKIGIGEIAWIEFDRLANLLSQAADPGWASGVFEATAEIFRGWNWGSQASDPELMVGLVMATFVQNANSWCPHVCLLGASNTGKTMLANTLEALFTPLCSRSEDSTAAGIRQASTSRSRPTILDEWDTTKDRAALLTMMRSASRGAKRVVGRQNQDSQETAVKGSFWVAGIHTGLTELADKNRFIIMNLLPPPEDRAGMLSPPGRDQLYNLGCELLAVAIYYLPAALEAAVQLRAVARGLLHDPRQIESYSTPASFLAAAVPAYEDLEETFKLLIRSSADEEVETDEQSLIGDILGIEVDAGTKLRKKSVGRLVSMYRTAMSGIDRDFEADIDDIEEALERVGIIFRSNSGAVELICFHPGTVRKHLKSSLWKDKTLPELFRRMRGAASLRFRAPTQGQVRWWTFVADDFYEDHGITVTKSLF